MEISGMRQNSCHAPDQASIASMDKSPALVSVDELRDEEVLAALQSYTPGSAEEKKLVRKTDLVLLPLLWWMYILAYLDRGNIANANAAGMSEDLGMSENEYALLVSLFFVAYVIFEVPSNMRVSIAIVRAETSLLTSNRLLMKIKPSIYLSTIVWVWGCAIVGMSQATDSRAFVAGRFFLGMIEAGLFPGAVFLLSCWYTKREIGKRVCIFYTSGCIAPALGGIMAGAITSSLEGARGMAGWRWLLLVEGVITVGCGFALYFLLPNYPRDSKMLLTPEQRLLGHVRILCDRNETIVPEDEVLTPMQAVKAMLTDLRVYFFLAINALNLIAFTMTYFIPTMLKGIGYDSVDAQWMTVPIWACGAVFQVFWSWTSDKTQDRRWHIAGLLALAAIGAFVSVLVINSTVKYVMMCFMIGGMYTALPLTLNWASECLARPERKRSVAIAFVNSMGHTSFIYGSYLWPASEGPRNLKGFATCTAALGLAAIIAALLPILIKYLPKQEVEGVNHSQADIVIDDEEKIKE